MAINARKTSDSELTIYLDKTFDFNCVDSFRRAYEQQQEDKKIKCYVIDFRDTQYIDSSALGMLINMQKNISEKNVSIRLVNPNSNIKKIFSISRFDKKFEIQ